MYLLIGIWGSGPKEYSAMKLTLMLMEDQHCLWWLIWNYFNSTLESGLHTFNLTEIARIGLPVEVQRYFFPFTFVGFGFLARFSLCIPVARWPCFGSYGSVYAACGY